MFVKRIASFTAGALALTALLSAVTPSRAQEQGWPINHPTGSSSFPWNTGGYQGYDEPRYASQPIPLSAATSAPQKYEVYVNIVPMENTTEPNAATLVAHVPDNARIWIDDKATTSTGTLRTFQSPALTTGKSYYYTVAVAWVEDGKVVSQSREFPVKAGVVQCVYLVQSGSKLEREKDVVAANLAKLDAEDRKLAEAQGFCAVQNGVRLGAMGEPFKIVVKGQPVFLCCEACSKRAENDPEKTLAKVKGLKAKAEARPSK